MLLPVCLSPTPLPALTSSAALTALRSSFRRVGGTGLGGDWEMRVFHYFFLSVATGWPPLWSLLYTREKMVLTSHRH